MRKKLIIAGIVMLIVSQIIPAIPITVGSISVSMSDAVEFCEVADTLDMGDKVCGGIYAAYDVLTLISVAGIAIVIIGIIKKKKA